MLLKVWVKKDCVDKFFAYLNGLEVHEKKTLSNSYIRLTFYEADIYLLNDIEKAAENGCELVGFHSNSTDEFDSAAFYSTGSSLDMWDTGVNGGWVIYNFTNYHLEELAKFERNWRKAYAHATNISENN